MSSHTHPQKVHVALRTISISLPVLGTWVLVLGPSLVHGPSQVRGVLGPCPQFNPAVCRPYRATRGTFKPAPGRGNSLESVAAGIVLPRFRSEEHTSELQSQS